MPKDKKQKDKILKELYRGRINPTAAPIKHDSEYCGCLAVVCSLEEELNKQLSEKNKKLLQDFITAQSELGYANAEEQFVAGFRLGAKMILEIFEKDIDDEQLQSIIG